MASDEKNRPGLHKEISSIFAGVPIPQNNPAPQSPAGSEPGPAGNAPMTPPAVQPQSPIPVQPPQPTPVAPRPVQAEIPRPQPQVPPKGLTQVRKNHAWQSLKNKLFTPRPGVSSARQKAMVLLVPLLIIVFVFVIVRFLGKSPRKIEASDNDVVVGLSGSGSQIDWKIPEPYPATLRDPMHFGSTESVPSQIRVEGDLVVRGILFSRDHPSAVIGTHVVHEGDEISGATIVKINRDSVEFERDGKQWSQGVKRQNLTNP